ncbi:MAG: hypothetical protein AB7D38_07890 [Sulfurimonas sp.]|uniref:hypothetical protein n=1 Tax=Sulfurimonas sp. TaxID=2022749 RepID=UPI003D09DAC5
MGKIIGIITAWITKNALWSVALKVLAVTYYLSLVAMATSFFYMLSFFIQTIRSFLNFTTTYSGSSELLSKVFAALNLSGFSQAINDTSGLISTALVFLLSRILIVNVNKLYKAYYDILAHQASNNRYL